MNQYFTNKEVSVKHIEHVIMASRVCSIKYIWTNYELNG